VEQINCNPLVRAPWNKGKIVGQKTPFKLKEIWAIRVRLQLADLRRELALFNLAAASVRSSQDARTGCMQRKDRGAAGDRYATEDSAAVKFEITEPTREAVNAWVGEAHLLPASPLFPSRVQRSPHISTRQYARIVES
jgi:hypothetical protein